ncbi:hypothetical protein C8R44DRAFT_890083 [Mycena epipterygia]|nr:hypothetical protein C8R44DRAFT_890083 [Mycena epipterygia]
MTVLSQTAPSIRLSSGYEKVDEIQRVGVRMLLVESKDHRAARDLSQSPIDHAAYRQIAIANPLLLTSCLTPSRSIRSWRELRDLPWLQRNMHPGDSVNPSVRRKCAGGRYSTRVFYHAGRPSCAIDTCGRQCSIHCNSIHALSVTKRGLPAPPPSPHVGVAAEYDAAREDDEFYATHARTSIAVVPSLPPSFPSSAAYTAAAARTATHRESLVLPAPNRAFVRLSRACAVLRLLSFVLELHTSLTSSTSSPSPDSPALSAPFQAQVPADVLDVDDAEEWEDPPPMNLPRAPPPAHPPALSCNFVDWPLSPSSPSSPTSLECESGAPPPPPPSSSFECVCLSSVDRVSVYNSAPIPAPCSRWSVSLSSSLRSAHARSPSKAFFAQRYFPVPRVPSFAGRGFSAPSLPSSFACPRLPTPATPTSAQWATYPLASRSTPPTQARGLSASASNSPSSAAYLPSPALHIRDAVLVAPPRVDGVLGLQLHLLALAFSLQLRTFRFRALGVHFL